MKKHLIIFLCVVLLMSIIFNGCAKDVESRDPATGSDAQKSDDIASADDEPASTDEDDSILTAPGEFPLVKEGENITLTMTVSTAGYVDDYVDNEFTKWFQEKTGVNFEFTVIPGAERAEKLNLMMNTEDYTDILMAGGFTLGQQQLFASQGILMPLNDYIDKYGVYVKEAFLEYPDFDIPKLYTLLDGNMYCLPQLVECYHCRVGSKMWIYEPWLDALDLNMPTTTVEFYQVLKAFKERDPNGNGKPDEIPLAGTPKDSKGKIDMFIMNAFVKNDGGKRLLLEDGKIEVAYNKDEWKQGLEYIRKLYDEGLIAPESFTQDREQLLALAENPDNPILGAAPKLTPPGQTMGESGRWLEYKSVPALEGPNGVRTVALYRDIGNESRFFITNKCKYPEVAFRVGDALYEDEVFMRSIFGRPDIEWREAKEGELGIDGNQGLVHVTVSNEEKRNVTWYMAPDIEPLKFRFGRVFDNNPLESILYEESNKNYYPYADDLDTTVIPDLIFTEEQAAELADIESSLQTYVEEMVARFVTRDADLESDWDNYIRELDNLGVGRYVELYQSAYDAKYK